MFQNFDYPSCVAMETPVDGVQSRFCLILSIIFGTSYGYLDATPRGDQPKTFHKLRV